MSDHSPSVCAAVRIANRFLEQLPAREQEQALIALVEVGNASEAATANDVLFHQRKRDRAQLTLKTILEGEGK